MEIYHQDGKIPSSDIDLVESLSSEYKLPAPVVNVLIEYVMLTQQRRLPRALVEKIAGHWKRLNMSTAHQAFEMAKKEHQMYKEWTSRKTSSSSSQQSYNGGSRKKASSQAQDKLPEWVKKQLDEEKSGQGNKVRGDTSVAEGKASDGTVGPEGPLTDQQRRSLELLRALGEIE